MDYFFCIRFAATSESVSSYHNPDCFPDIPHGNQFQAIWRFDFTANMCRNDTTFKSQPGDLSQALDRI